MDKLRVKYVLVREYRQERTIIVDEKVRRMHKLVWGTVKGQSRQEEHSFWQESQSN